MIPWHESLALLLGRLHVSELSASDVWEWSCGPVVFVIQQSYVY